MSIREAKTVAGYSLRGTLPGECRDGTWVGRAWLPSALSRCGVPGPHVIVIRGAEVIEVSETFETLVALVRDRDPARAVKSACGRSVCSLADLLEDSCFRDQPEDPLSWDRPFLLAPNDLQAIKACGVTIRCVGGRCEIVQQPITTGHRMTRTSRPTLEAAQ